MICDRAQHSSPSGVVNCTDTDQLSIHIRHIHCWRSRARGSIKCVFYQLECCGSPESAAPAPLVSQDIGNCRQVQHSAHTIAPSLLPQWPMNQSPTKFSLYIANRRQARERRRFFVQRTAQMAQETECTASSRIEHLH